MAGDAGTVPSTQTPAQALEAAEAALLVVTAVDEEGATRPVAVVSRAQLAALAAEPGTLADLTDRLPSLVSVDAAAGRLDQDTLLQLADALALAPEVPAALVENGTGESTVLSRTEVAAALPLELLADGDRRGTLPDLPTRRYVCRKCAPPSYRLPRSTGEATPSCRRIWFHGAMELDG